MAAPDHFALALDGFIDAGSCVLVQDTMRASAVFVMQALLRRALSQGDKVLLVALETSLEKYSYCLRKLGVNLQQHVDSRQLVVIGAGDAGLAGWSLEGGGDALAALHARLADAVRDASSSSSSSGSECDTSATPRSDERGGGAASTGTSGRVTVLLDNVSALSAYQDDARSWLAFLQQLTALGRHAVRGKHGDGCPTTVVLLAHGDVPGDEAWLRWLRHCCDAALDVDALDGKIADIDGTVTVTRRGLQVVAAGGGCRGGAGGAGAGLVRRDEALEVQRRLYFRAGEISVKYFQASDLMSVAR
ncbi:hypothetical protein FOA52_005610 [Chlamydomonas sp. UWO 241]|nr:hypothetical protein FOA52_004585 [Chlamydomonas sp. UWO 241]KAG1658446.1 hypothetical protein FOA52_005610 [Chlamydomonas sp. UWO 241]